MSMFRTTALLCVSLCVTPAWAETGSPFVTQLRLPARDITLDVFAWRDGDAVIVSRSDLERMDVVVPEGVSGDRVPLAAIPGMTASINESAASVDIVCTAACFETQQIGQDLAPRPLAVQSSTGAYLNYDVEARWLDDTGLDASGIGETTAFGPWGLVETSWLGATSGEARGATRLETSWTVDRPGQHLRMRFGDSTALSASNTPVRFAGVQIGRHFGLEPSMITYPTALLSGEAATASTVELYVDGALRASERVEAGPFVFNNAPLVTGAGEAELVVTDVAGRQQIISRPFFVSTSLLRPGLSDWTFSAGSERRDFGRRSISYGAPFASARYRVGVTNAWTADAGVDTSEEGPVYQAGATFAGVSFGQVRLARAEGAHGGATEASWFRQGDILSFGMQADVRDPGFRNVGLSTNTLRSSYAATVGANFGWFGTASFVAAAVDDSEEPLARTYALAYSPDFLLGSLTARLMYSEAERSELAFGLAFSLSLNGNVSSSFSYDVDDQGSSYRVSSQRSPAYAGGFGWRANSIAGRQERLEFAGTQRGQFGDTVMQVARTGSSAGARIQHAGSVGVIEGYRFAARPIEGAFALVDAGAPRIGVSRDRLTVGATGRDGRVIATGLRPYDANSISIAADDLPFDRAPSTTEIRVAPAEGAGVVIRFEEASEQLVETRARFASGEAPPRGSILVRGRDGARFPIGTDGRIVLTGTRAGDVLALDSNRACVARANPVNVMDSLVLECAVS